MKGFINASLGLTLKPPTPLEGFTSDKARGHFSRGGGKIGSLIRALFSADTGKYGRHLRPQLQTDLK